VDRLAQRLATARKALTTLMELPLGQSADAVVRDAAIQRFEYTLEALWKAAQLYLREHEGLERASPKGVVRACFELGLLSGEEARAAMQMVDDGNANPIFSLRMFTCKVCYCGYHGDPKCHRAYAQGPAPPGQTGGRRTRHHPDGAGD